MFLSFEVGDIQVLLHCYLQMLKFIAICGVGVYV